MAPEVLIRDRWIPPELEDWRQYNPKTDLGHFIKRCARFLPAEMGAELVQRVSRVVIIQSSLALRRFLVCSYCGRHPGPNHLGLYTNACRCPGWERLVEDYGTVSERVVTTAGVNFLVDAWQNLFELEIMRYHGIGTGTTAEAVGDTALVTELTTQYNPDNTRATGTLAEGTSANIFKTVGTNTVDAGVTIQEHGLLSQAAVPGGTLDDRSLTGAKVLNSGEGLESDYQQTVTAGG